MRSKTWSIVLIGVGVYGLFHVLFSGDVSPGDAQRNAYSQALQPLQLAAKSPVLSSQGAVSPSPSKASRAQTQDPLPEPQTPQPTAEQLLNVLDLVMYPHSIETLENWLSDLRIPHKTTRTGHPRTGERLELRGAFSGGSVAADYSIDETGEPLFSSIRWTLAPEAELFQHLALQTKTQLMDIPLTHDEPTLKRWEDPESHKAIWLRTHTREDGQTELQFTVEFIECTHEH